MSLDFFNGKVIKSCSELKICADLYCPAGNKSGNRLWQFSHNVFYSLNDLISVPLHSLETQQSDLWHLC